jgi:2-amino-4-hydroxy-6-hydroxymethyldihydropteridine diphosphokinase
MMPYYLVGLGSNLEPELNITKAYQEIALQVSILDHSPVLINPPCGTSFQFTFHNQILLIQSEHSSAHLKALFEHIEISMGREPKSPERRLRDRPIDIDILAQSTSAESILSTPFIETYNQAIMHSWHPG